MSDVKFLLYPFCVSLQSLLATGSSTNFGKVSPLIKYCHTKSLEYWLRCSKLVEKIAVIADAIDFS